MATELNKQTLAAKDRDELFTIAKAMGGKPGSRARKGDVVDLILQLAGVTGEPEPAAEESTSAEPPPPRERPTNKSRAEAVAASGNKNKHDETVADSDDDDHDDDDADEDDNGDGGNDVNDDGSDASYESGNRRRRRRRGRDRERTHEGEEAEPLPVDGYLDTREEGFGFLRVDGARPSKKDVYISLKLVRQHGLRKGDKLTGLARPASRNEKNPALSQLDTVNGGPPDDARGRPQFRDLTPIFPNERITLERPNNPHNMITRIVDLLAPIGKGQRGLIVSPPKAGKTTIMKEIAKSIETNHPECTLVVLLLDERPEEVTDMERWLKNGEVLSSTFDRPTEEHIFAAELAIERAKRLVESGLDVVLLVDGITRLARAYNLAAPGTGRMMSGGVDASALYPPKKFFGAARNLEDGGSLTILATALVDTGSRMDEVIFEEFKGTGNMELRLSRSAAERRVYPAIDVDGSSTRHDELLLDKKELNQINKLRRVLVGLASDGGHASTAGLEMLIDRLGTFATNADFLAEIGKK